MSFIIEAMVQHVKEGPYVKIVFIDENPNVDLHMEQMMKYGDIYHILSVKSRPADEVTLQEFMYDMQGNMDTVDGVPVNANAISDSPTNTDTGSD